MAWPTIPEHHRPLFQSVLPDDPRVETKQMFGTVVCTVDGQMFGGLWADSMMVRLSPADRAEVLAMGGEPFDPMHRGASKDKVVLPTAMMSDREGLRAWLRRALESTAALPPKAKKAAAAKKPSAKPAAAKKAAAKRTSAKPPTAKKTAKKPGANRAATTRPAAKKAAAKKKAAKA